MPEQSICSFCGKGAEHVVEGPNGAYACRDCLLMAREVISGMQKTYTCSFCFEPMPGNAVVEGGNNLHMCQACIDSGLKLLMR